MEGGSHVEEGGVGGGVARARGEKGPRAGQLPGESGPGEKQGMSASAV